MKKANEWANEIKKASQGDDYYFYSHADALIEQIQIDAWKQGMQDAARISGREILTEMIDKKEF